jgi:hypothetical protein
LLSTVGIVHTMSTVNRVNTMDTVNTVSKESTVSIFRTLPKSELNKHSENHENSNHSE